ncbi:hypothetical protein [Variovorax sp. UMC13]|uniref:hypothetical protein n=1 Tax=Variovorax sp. UMC13 TaxID=1862326 RepID=UPI0016042EF1|nr:hypothetical protein [Variovorax sp. UMC13]MBB1599475.1 hypothetical protein [Variovorax sp. UMC13]
MTGIVVLPSIIVPQSVLMAGMSGVHSRQNQRVRNQGGFATVNTIRDATMRAWQIGTGPMSLSVADQIFGLYEVTDAGAFGMLFLDPIDAAVAAEDGALQGYQQGVEFGVPGFGSGGPRYGLRKMYTARGSGLRRGRALTRPIGNPAMLRGGSPVPIGAAAGNASLTAAPVYVDFVPDATRTINALAVGATTQVTLDSPIGVIAGGRLWLQGIGGEDAALLNGKSHQVAAVAGTVYTLAVDTSGKAITATGQGHKYPQPDEALTWSGGFYVPVHFRDDNLDWDLVIPGPAARRQVVIPSTFIDEIREA